MPEAAPGLAVLLVWLGCTLGVGAQSSYTPMQGELDPGAAAGQVAPAAAQPVGGAAPLVLHGGLQHSERLAPVEPQLQAGVVFNAQTLPPMQPNNEWYWIPTWYAGHKHVESATILRDYNFADGRTITPNRVVMDRQDLAIGFQCDRNGQVWEFKRAPYTTTVEGERSFTTIMVRSRDPVSVGQNNVVIRMVQTSVNVDKRSRRILKTLQEEQFNVYVPAGQGVMNMQTSIKSFGADGSPLVQENSVRTVTQTAPFTPIDLYEGRDLRQLFREYLQSHGFANYVPDQQPQQAEPPAYAQQGYPQQQQGYPQQQQGYPQQQQGYPQQQQRYPQQQQGYPQQQQGYPQQQQGYPQQQQGYPQQQQQGYPQQQQGYPQQ